MSNKLSGKDLIKIGFPANNTINITLGLIQKHYKKESKETILEEAKNVLLAPEKYTQHAVWGKLVQDFIPAVEAATLALNEKPAPFKIFGENEIDGQAKLQLYQSLQLPIAIKGALMPDAHAGYGLPIGGVLATENAIIPYGVGVDIGCRMSLSVFDLPASFLKGKTQQLKQILIDNTQFGMYDTHKIKSDNEIFERSIFNEIPILKNLKDKAYQQLGTSGSGNHFVEFGIVKLDEVKTAWQLPQGEYLAILSHSGSRGLGANIAQHYTQIATKQSTLPKHVKHLAWLDLNTQAGQEYWLAMNLAGDYAKACHDNIHYRIAKALGKRIVFNIENHHNFAWKESINGKTCIVHRKGATPAGKGVLGIIPGSMTAPGFIVEGLGNEDSLNSASHGAGRKMSRETCKSTITKSAMNAEIKAAGIELIGGNIDEAPFAYKDIQKVMIFQNELVKTLGTFSPKIVRMDKH